MIIGVGVDVAKGGKEGACSNLGLLESLLVQLPFGLVLVGGVLTLVLVLGVGVLSLVLGLGGLMLVFVGAVGDEVVEAATSKASFLLCTTPTVHAVVVKPREPVDDQCQVIISKYLQLFLCEAHSSSESLLLPIFSSPSAMVQKPP